MTQAGRAAGAREPAQWVPGAGREDRDWSGPRRRIDELGKGQIYQSGSELSASRIRAIWESFASRKLYFQVRPDVHDELQRTWQ